MMLGPTFTVFFFSLIEIVYKVESINSIYNGLSYVS